MSTVQETTAAIRREAARALVGQDEPLTLALVALLSGGHVLLEGVPGTAKTLMSKTLARLTQAEFKRVQFTPDLMPSDVVGTQVFEMHSGQFHLRKGPIFTQILLGDEINRAPAKTQSALLEAMEERQVTIEGQRLALPEPFFVLATQNPIEHEGTYPLPEAQLDRFLFKIIVEYAPQDVEIEVLRRYHQGFDARNLDSVQLQPLITPDTLTQCRREIGTVEVDEGIMKYITDIAQESRKSLDLVLGGSPRASIALLLTSKTYAAMQGRAYVSPDDVKFLVRPVYRHRILLKPEAEVEGLTPDTAMDRLLARVEVPR
jgi:MoxR-like ATPase